MQYINTKYIYIYTYGKLIAAGYKLISIDNHYSYTNIYFDL